MARPIIRRQLAMLAVTVSKKVPVSFRRAGRRRQCRAKPLVSIRTVVSHNVDEDLDARAVQGRRLERTQPDRIDTEVAQVRHSRDDPAHVTEAIAIRVGERPRIDLVDDGLPPPLCVLVLSRVVDRTHFTAPAEIPAMI